MIKCKLISPTNLLLEHPMLLAKDDEEEFYVIGKKEFEKSLRNRTLNSMAVGLMGGMILAVLIIGLVPR